MNRFQRPVILLCLVLVSSVSSSQILADLCESLDYQKLSNGLQMLVNTPPKEGESYSIKKLIQNELTSNYWQEVYRIEYAYNNPDSMFLFEQSLFELKLVRNGDEIIYFFLKKFDSPESSTPVRFWKEKNLESMNALQDTFKSHFGRPINPDELFAVGVTYGSKCGRAGELLPLRARLIEALENNDQTELSDWLSSGIPEKQAFALEGFLQMEEEGQLLPEVIKARIERFKNKGGIMLVCEGNRLKYKEISFIVAEISSRFQSDE